MLGLPLLALLSLGANPTAKMRFTGGFWGSEEKVIGIELFLDKMPVTVSNFIDLAKTGFYDGTHLHRVVPDEYIFGGCPFSKDLTNSKVGTGSPEPGSVYPNLGVCSKTSECVIGDTLKRNAEGGIDEEQMPANAPLNLAGTISMGRASKKGKPVLPATDGMWGSLFFFNVVDHPPLNEKFPVFGKVKCNDCLEFLTKVSQVTQAGHTLAGSGQPEDPIKLVSVTIEAPEDTAACNRRQLQVATFRDQDSWTAEWTHRIECWWMFTPYQSGLQACLGALGLTLASRFDTFFNRPRKPAPAQAGCEALMKQVELELPDFPAADNFKWTVPAIPRLLPNWGRLYQLQSWVPDKHRPQQRFIATHEVEAMPTATATNSLSSTTATASQPTLTQPTVVYSSEESNNFIAAGTAFGVVLGSGLTAAGLFFWYGGGRGRAAVVRAPAPKREMPMSSN